MYIAEIAPPKWRGRLLGFFQFNVVFGILLAYLYRYTAAPDAGVLVGYRRWIATSATNAGTVCIRSVFGVNVTAPNIPATMAQLRKNRRAWNTP